MRFGPLVLVLVASLLLAACQSGGPNGSPDASVQPTPIPSMTPEDLADLIPDRAGGITLFKFPMTGEEFLDGAPDPAFAALLADLGADTEDISVVSAIGANEDESETAIVFAFRVAGADAETMISAFEDISDSSGSPLDWHEETIGGKSVQVSSTNADFEDPIVLYATGDILFFVTTTDGSITEDILRALT